jgi:amino acid permease
MKRALGRVGEWLAISACVLNSFGACVAYLMIIGENFSPIFERVFYGPVGAGGKEHTRTHVILLFSLLILPLCCMPKVSQLSYSSFFSICSIIFIVSLVCLFGLLGTVDVTGRHTPSLLFSYDDVTSRSSSFRDVHGLLTALPLICFSFQVLSLSLSLSLSTFLFFNFL